MFKDRLFAFRDEWYRGFQSKLVPTVEDEKIIGIRTPTTEPYKRQSKATA